MESGTDSDAPSDDADSENPDASYEEGSISFSSENAASHSSGNTGSGDGILDDTTLGELYPDREMPTISVDSIGYIGYIFIPSLSIRLPVQGDWVYDLLTISPSRYSGSVYQNNMIIGGHSYITHFRALRNISSGARVFFYDTEGYTYEYEVTYAMSLNPNQGAVLFDEESEDWDLTLFTCNTGGQTRCIVRCVRVE